MIQLEAISKHFILGDQTVRAVDELDLTIDDNEYMSVMGPSGSGKSTLLNIIALLDRPTSGRYELEGVDTTALSDDDMAALRQSAIGFVFQFFHLVNRLSAARNVELPLILAGLPAAERTRRVEEALENLGIADRARHRPTELSGGQRQRVAIARAMVNRPRILLADEPTGNLDSASGAQVVEILETLHAEHGVTLLVVTHDADLGRRAHRRLRLVDGRIDRDERGPV